MLSRREDRASAGSGGTRTRTHLMEQRATLTPGTRARARERVGGEAFDLRPALALERRLLPALLLVAALTAVAATAGAPGGAALAWLALAAMNAAVRYVVASMHAEDLRAVAPGSAPGRVYAFTAAADVVVWAMLLTAVPSTGVFLGAAAALLLGALSYGGWPRVWTFYVAGWIAVYALGAGRATGALPAVAVAFPLWLAAVWWIGRRPAVQAPEAAASPQTLISNPTRFGWQAAIHAMPTPVLVIRRGRIAEANRAACDWVGKPESAVVGSALGDCLTASPAGVLDPLAARGRADVHAEVRAARGAGAAAAWSARVRVLEPGSPSSVVVVALTREVRPAAPSAPLLDDARRISQVVGGDGALPWCRDDHGRLVVPDPFPPPPEAERALDDLGFPLAYLVPPADRASVDALYLDALRTGGLFDQRVRLVDAAGAMRLVRVVCMTRPPTGRGLTPLVGAIAEPASGTAAAQAGEILSRLPVLVWMVDANGRLVHVQGDDPGRWGLRAEPRLRPRWYEAFEVRSEWRFPMMNAIGKALRGKPVYDVVNARTGRSGGRLQLRSHFVPHEHDGQRAVMVLDTIASPNELLEIDQLKRSKAQYKSLVEASASLIWACDADLKLTFVSRRAAREMYGYDARELLGRDVGVLLPTDEQPAVRSAFEALQEGRPVRDLEAVHVTRDGHRLIVSISAVPLRRPDGRFAGVIGMNADLTTLKSRERRLSEALRVERTVLDSAGQAIAVVKQGLVQRCNDAFLRLAGLPPEDLAKTAVAGSVLDADDWHDVAEAAELARARDEAVVREVRVRRSASGRGNGAAWCQVTARSIAPGEFVLVVADIDTLKQREESALHEAQHDELTGLPNRRLLAERAAAALATSELRRVSCAVLAIDLDGFKEINDRWGHEAGDLMLREVAVRLARAMRPQDTVARRGGDEFAVLVPDVGSMQEVEKIAERLLKAVALPATLSGVPQELTVSASIGVALAPEQGRDLERLLQLADVAMYDAKLKGKNRYALAQVAAETAPLTNVRQLVPRAVRYS